MSTVLAVYQKRLDLQKAEFSRIEHDDAIVADVYKIVQADGPQFILKIFASPDSYLREVYFLEHFAGTVSVPLLVQVVEPEPGVDGAILMECLPGALVRTTDWTAELACDVGVTLARIHLNRTEGFGDLTKPEELTSDPSVYFGRKFEEELAECRGHLPSELIKQISGYYRTQRHLLAHVDGPCMIHRDFRPGNIIVNEGKLQGIIDWAGGRSGFAEQDFCSMEHRKWPPRLADRESLLEGYASIRPVPDYSGIMPLIRLGRALAVIGFTVNNGTWDNKNARIYRFNRKFLDTFTFGSSKH